MRASTIPHLKMVIAVSAFVLAGFGVVSGYVLGYSADEVTKGNVIGTWINFAMLAVGFWLGSSSGGKARPESLAERRERKGRSDTGEPENGAENA